jgi:hypothetical protein
MVHIKSIKSKKSSNPLEINLSRKHSYSHNDKEKSIKIILLIVNWNKNNLFLINFKVIRLQLNLC